MEGYIFNKNEEAIESIKSQKKKSPEQQKLLTRCRADNMTLLSKTKYNSLDKDEVEKAFEKLRARRKEQELLAKTKVDGNRDQNNS